jgi:AcrR family transcriptional regulator
MPGATPPESQSYHHGNLRDALIAAALELEPDHGPLGISLREVARRVGVTHAAAYHHFENKEALVRAVAEEGFAALVAELDRDIAGARDPFFAVIDAAVSYTRFALRAPSRFRFMYGTAPSSAAPLEAKHAELLERFAGVVRSAQAGKLIAPGPVERPAAQLWSVAHGFASLTLTGALDGAPRARKDKRTPKQGERRALDLVRATTVGLLLGMAPPDSPWRARLQPPA